jgi:hypothetical protein
MTDVPVAAALLQQKADEVNRASEVIDRDPEEAVAKLAPSSPNGQAITINDVLQLFLQLQQAQSGMQSQIVQLLSQQKDQQITRAQAHTADDLERVHKKQQATLEAWKQEPREPVFLEPTADERKAAEVHNGEYPPRVHWINGIAFPVKVNEIVSVPASIAALVRHTQGASRRLSRPAQQVQTIADPDAGQFLAGSVSMTQGQQGKVGEGPILVAQLPQRQDEAQPLDVRYDAFGR